MMEATLLISFAGMVLATLTAAAWTTSALRHARRRTSDLETAERALRAHYLALEQVLDCHDVSDRMKRGVLHFHRSVIAREAAEVVAKWLASKEFFETPAQNDEFDVEYHRLKQSNPPVFEALHTTIHSGIVTLMFRWPETARYFRKVPLEQTIDDQRERSITHALIEKGKDDHGDSSMNGSLVAA